VSITIYLSPLASFIHPHRMPKSSQLKSILITQVEIMRYNHDNLKGRHIILSFHPQQERLTNYKSYTIMEGSKYCIKINWY